LVSDPLHTARCNGPAAAAAVMAERRSRAWRGGPALLPLLITAQLLFGAAVAGVALKAAGGRTTVQDDIGLLEALRDGSVNDIALPCGVTIKLGGAWQAIAGKAPVELKRDVRIRAEDDRAERGDSCWPTIDFAFVNDGIRWGQSVSVRVPVL
jgi:hypothetical protein